MSDLNVSGIQASLTGLTRAADQANKAAQDILAATAAPFKSDVDKAGEAAERAADADNVALSSQAAAVNDVATENARAAAVVADVSSGDLAKPLVDLIAAKQAFDASATTMRVTADVEQKLIGMVKS